MLYIYGDMDPINIPQMLAYIPYMDPMGMENYHAIHGKIHYFYDFP